MNENTKKKLEGLLEYYRVNKKREGEANILCKLGNYNEAAYVYEEIANKCFKNKLYVKAFLYFSLAAENYFKGGKREQRQECFELASQCESFKLKKESTDSFNRISDSLQDIKSEFSTAIIKSARIRAAQEEKNYSTLNVLFRDGFNTISNELKNSLLTLSNSILGGFKTLSEAQQSGLKELAESVFNGFNNLSISQKEAALIQAESILAGFENLSNAQKESAVYSAIGTLGGFHELADSQKIIAKSLVTGFNNISTATLENSKAVFYGLKNMAEVQKLNTALHNQTLKEIAEKDSETKIKQFMILQNALLESTNIASRGILKGSMRVARSVRGGMFSDGFGRGLKDLATLGLFRKGAKHSIEEVASALTLGSRFEVKGLLPPATKEAIKKKIIKTLT